MKLENLTGIRAVTLYDLIQMALLSCVLAVTLRRMASRGCCNGLILGGWLFVLLNPVIAVFSLETAKDVYLGIFFLPVTLLLIDLVSDPEIFLHSRRQCFLLALNLLLICMFRNNVILVVVIMLPIACMLLKKWWRRILVLFASVVLAFCLYSGPLMALLGVKSGNASEAFSVPIFQISNVVGIHGDKL